MITIQYYDEASPFPASHNLNDVAGQPTN